MPKNPWRLVYFDFGQGYWYGSNGGMVFHQIPYPEDSPMNMDSTNSTVPKIPYLREVAEADVSALYKARDNYGESWCKRGGVGAFMMLARKWDRMENFVANVQPVEYDRYDVLGAIERDVRPEGVIDDIRDLRRYLMLVEAKAAELGYESARTKLAKDSYSVDVKTTITSVQIEETVDYVRKLESDVKNLQKENATLIAENQRLNDFKLYTHERMDRIGVPANPDPVAVRRHGCRIGERFDWIIANGGILDWGLVQRSRGPMPQLHEDQPRASELHPK